MEIFILIFLCFFAITILVIASMWTIYSKAGKPGWACIIPVYNLIILLEITGKPWWWLLLLLIPIANLIFLIIIYHNLSLSFGKDGAFTVGIILLGFVFLPVLAFGDAQYIGPGGQTPLTEEELFYLRNQQQS